MRERDRERKREREEIQTPYIEERERVDTKERVDANTSLPFILLLQGCSLPGLELKLGIKRLFDWIS